MALKPLQRIATGAKMRAIVACLCASGCSGAISDEQTPATPPNVAGNGAIAAPAGSGSNASPVAGANAGGAGSAAAAPSACTPDLIAPGRAPLRRLTRFEYNNTVRELLGDTTNPADALPSEELGNGFGNDADAQSVSSLLAEQYSAVGEAVAARATATPALLGQLAPCAGQITAASSADEDAACARTVIEKLAPRAYRRPLDAGEADELLALYRLARTDATFAIGVATVIEALLQAPEFLYRVEFGEPDKTRPERIRPTGTEMASRLSYLLWGSMPDDALRAAAAAGELQMDEGVRAQAERMLDDERARPVLRFFFDNLLPIPGLAGLERDRTLFPTYTPAIGALMREEVQTFLEQEIFEGSGSWKTVLTAPYTYLNEPLAAFYGVTGVQGAAFRQVPLDTTRRLGLLTQAGMLAGTTHSNTTSPVIRGAYVVRKLMCTNIPLPTAELLGAEVFAMIKPPEPYTGKTARERYSAHSQQPVCASCHRSMDPVGLAFENFDAVGLWRDQENGVTIDASGRAPGADADVVGPVALARQIAERPETYRCFATHVMNFAFGRTLEAAQGDACTSETAQAAFERSGYDVRELLLALTQTDAFLYLPSVRE